MKFKTSIEIDGREISSKFPPLLIAEIGVNHNGDLDLAMRLIEAAKSSGAEAVKFQTFNADEFMVKKDDWNYEYDTINGSSSENMYVMFKRLEMKPHWHKILFDYCRSLGVIPLTSVADFQSLEIALDAGMSAIKLSSEDFVNIPLLDRVSKTGIPLILSTGMANEEEMNDVINLLAKNSCSDVVFLHCVSLYPTENHLAQLLRIKSLKNKFNSLVGYSDHTVGIEAPILSVALGATIIEKHFTINNNLSGPDHYMSADPEEFKYLSLGIKRAWEMLGGGELNPSKDEMKNREQFRRSLVAARDLKMGDSVKPEDLALKRVGFEGLRYRDMHLVNERKLLHDLNVGSAIKSEDVI